MSVKTVTFYLNGQSYTIPLDSSTGKYKKTVTAPSQTSWGETDHKYEMRLDVEDMAGNVTRIDKSHASFGEKMMLRVLEKTAPVITITKPSAGAYLGSNSVSVEFTVTDSESGVNPDSISLQLDSGAAITSALTKTQITNGYKCTYTITCQDGSHTIKVNASDNDGNAATQKTATFTVDTVPPELNIMSPASTLITNVQTLSVAGMTEAACSVVITLNGTNQGTVTVSANGQFSKNVQLVKGSNVIVIKSTDLAGKVTTVTREVTYDPVAPVIVAIEINPNPVDAGATFTITVEATDE